MEVHGSFHQTVVEVGVFEDVLSISNGYRFIAKDLDDTLVIEVFLLWSGGRSLSLFVKGDPWNQHNIDKSVLGDVHDICEVTVVDTEFGSDPISGFNGKEGGTRR